jgi:hypothetical protein
VPSAPGAVLEFEAIRGLSKMPQPNINAERERETAEARMELLRLAEEQGVQPFDFDRARVDFWPDEESTDDFLAWLRSARDEGSQPRRLPE